MIKKSGGIYFWSAGRIGGSFYLKRRRPDPYGVHPKRLALEALCAAAVGIPLGAYVASLFI